MVKHKLRLVVDNDVEQVAANISAADLEEGRALYGEDAMRLLTDSIALSLRAWTWEVDGQPAFIGGIAARDILGTVGVPWLVTTPLVRKYPLAFHRACYKVMCEHFLQMYPILENYVDARHELAIRWLRLLGFKVDDPRPLGVLGLPFYRFEMRT